MESHNVEHLVGLIVKGCHDIVFVHVFVLEVPENGAPAMEVQEDGLEIFVRFKSGVLFLN